MADKKNWLKEYLQGIDKKSEETRNVVKDIQATQTDLIRDTQRNWAAYQGLYKEGENHRLNKCGTMVKHEDNDHKGLFGKALGYTVGIFTLLVIIIGSAWYVFEKLN